MPSPEVPGPRRPLGSPAVTTIAPLTLHELATRAGHAAWLEGRLFEVVGGWVVSTPEADAVAHLATQSRRHAWHAELWADRIPEATIVDAAAVTRPASPAVASAIERAAALDGTPARLGALARLLSVLLDEYGAHRARTSPVCDGATARTLDLVMSDLRADLAALERLGGVDGHEQEALEPPDGLLGALTGRE